jgi:DNA polymerase-3 subunit gamma/tau
MHQPTPISEARPASTAPIEIAPRPEPVPEREASPFSAVSTQSTGFAETLTDGALAKAPLAETAPPAHSGSPSVEAVKQAIVTALAQQGHATASQLISTAQFTLESTSLRIEVPGVGKKMLALTVNAAAEKIIRQELQSLGGPARFMVIPGEGVAATSSIAAPVAGSIQQAALEHPMVQRAKEIFNAEVRSVVDLRSK